MVGRVDGVPSWLGCHWPVVEAAREKRLAALRMNELKLMEGVVFKYSITNGVG